MAFSRSLWNASSIRCQHARSPPVAARQIQKFEECNELPDMSQQHGQSSLALGTEIQVRSEPPLEVLCTSESRPSIQRKVIGLVTLTDHDIAALFAARVSRTLRHEVEDRLSEDAARCIAFSQFGWHAGPGASTA